MVLEFTDFDANNRIVSEACGDGRQIIKRETTRHAVIGWHDSRIEHIAIEMEIDRSVRNEPIEVAEHVGPGREGDNAIVDVRLLRRIQIASPSEDYVSGFEASSKSGVPPSEGSAQSETAEVTGCGVLRGVQIGVGVKLHHDGVRILSGNIGESRDGCGASRPREHRLASPFECGTMSRLQRPEPRQSRFQLDVPIAVDSRFGMTEDSRLSPQPTTKGGSDDGGTFHSAVIMISDAPGIYEDTAAHL